MPDLKAEIERLERLLAEKDKWPGKIARTSINLAPRLVQRIRELEERVLVLESPHVLALEAGNAAFRSMAKKDKERIRELETQASNSDEYTRRILESDCRHHRNTMTILVEPKDPFLRELTAILPQTPFVWSEEHAMKLVKEASIKVVVGNTTIHIRTSEGNHD